MTIPEHLSNPKPLKTYRPQQQHAGEFLSGFDWTHYFTGTFRAVPWNESEAVRRLDRSLQRLRESVGCPSNRMSCFAALEDRDAGLGVRPVRPHWHGLLACPEYPRLEQTARQLWIAEHGWFQIKPYDVSAKGPFYVCKLTSQGAYTHDLNLNRMAYKGPSDLLSAAAANPYVAERLNAKVAGEYLVVAA